MGNHAGSASMMKQRRSVGSPRTAQLYLERFPRWVSEDGHIRSKSIVTCARRNGLGALRGSQCKEGSEDDAAHDFLGLSVVEYAEIAIAERAVARFIHSRK